VSCKSDRDGFWHWLFGQGVVSNCSLVSGMSEVCFGWELIGSTAISGQKGKSMAHR
jgi:hypothetical protein